MRLSCNVADAGRQAVRTRAIFLTGDDYVEEHNEIRSSRAFCACARGMRQFTHELQLIRACHHDQQHGPGDDNYQQRIGLWRGAGD
jgi:hypothetical protein